MCAKETEVLEGGERSAVPVRRAVVKPCADKQSTEWGEPCTRGTRTEEERMVFLKSRITDQEEVNSVPSRDLPPRDLTGLE